MRMTPLDIQNHRFGRRFPGYDRAEVATFLCLVAEDYESLLRENEARRSRILQLENRVEELMTDEKLLKQTLLSAHSMTEDLKEAAARESELLVSEAEVKAEKILDASHRRAARLAEEIREMRGLRSRLATALRSSIETHLALIESLEEAPEEEEESKVTYLARTPAARNRQTESNGGV
jgi:cell division initiation protein